MWHTMMNVIRDPVKNRGPLFLVIWLAWVVVGFFFYSYAPKMNLGWRRGWYMAINIGYSIGFGEPGEDYDPYLWFSTIYVLIGSSFIGVALSFFADKIGEDHDNWFTNLVQQKAYEESIRNSRDPWVLLKAIYVQYEAIIRAITVWVIWIGIMIVYSIWGLGWSYVQAQYFAITTLSTGGHWGLPVYAPDWMWPLTAFMAMLGVPLMGVAMAQLATLMVDQGDIEVTKKELVEDVTGEELLMLRKFGLENGDGVIDSAEYIILCMVRMGQDPSLIEFISNRFKELDDDDSGYLTIEEITGGKYFLKNGQIVSKVGGVLGVKGVKQFSMANLHVELSSSSEGDDKEKGGLEA
ncbi:expressed unknown protein [Seminavis robusta]|uniref:EF-hand domain-containing protein n=1 Tax=Seminavis robusta TaxID=568900 RepID=A0A9N8E5D1_9STRA|nr:expressed unknown protein [Seminavis robusta]|eukprot:Sro677_g185810.1 n/a (351) ;mRNA; r:18924-20321